MSHETASLRHCEQILREIDLPEPFDMQTLCDRLGKIWGSTVVLFPTSTVPAGPCGMWISLEISGQLYDVFAYEQAAPAWHQAQVIFHEIGHRALGHMRTNGFSLGAKKLVETLLPHADPDVVDRALGCARQPSAYDDPDERDAEYFGTRLLDRAFGWRSDPLWADASTGLRLLHTALANSPRPVSRQDQSVE